MFYNYEQQLIPFFVPQNTRLTPVYFNQAMPSAIGGSVPVGVGSNAGNTVSNTVSGSGTTHSTSTTIAGNTHIPNNEECGIRDVWRHNLEEEFRTIRQIVQKYHYVAMDTEFPGVVARPIGEFRSTADYQYQLLRCNVDLLRIIQLGLTFMDDEAKTPIGYSTWQFNFKFNLSEDMYAQDSIDLLQNSGIQFKKHEEEGIEPSDFAELLLTSGIVLMDNIKWLSFHSGYDFGYLLKLLTDQNLPSEEGDFFELLRLYFPNIYDVKYLMKSCKNLKGGLQEVADQLELRRVGPQHQAGSDSHLTGMAFFKMREVYDSVEFRLALKNSEEKLFWRCAEEVPNVASTDADNNSNADAKSNRTIATAIDSRATLKSGSCAAVNSECIASNTADNSTIIGNSDGRKSVADIKSICDGTAVDSAADKNTKDISTVQASTAVNISANSTDSGQSTATNTSASDSSVEATADMSTTDINQNIILKETTVQ